MAELPFYTLHAAVLETRGYIVGEANAPSGLHRYEGAGCWTHLGWRNVRAFGLAASPDDPRRLYLAAGNGVFRTNDGGTSWRVLTDWRITEVLDVAVDPHQPVCVYAATAHGVWRSEDRGDTWAEANDGLAPLPFTQSLTVDDRPDGPLVAGTEHGLYCSFDGGRQWSAVGSAGVPIRCVRQSKADLALWLAGAEDHGAWRSTDGGITWAPANVPSADQTFYAVALDPLDPLRMTAAGYRHGLYVSTDGGAAWTRRTMRTPEPIVLALAFDPAMPGRLWAGTAQGLLFTDDLGETWTAAGLAEAVVRALAFFPTPA